MSVNVRFYGQIHTSFSQCMDLEQRLFTNHSFQYGICTLPELTHFCPFFLGIILFQLFVSQAIKLVFCIMRICGIATGLPGTYISWSMLIFSHLFGSFLQLLCWPSASHPVSYFQFVEIEIREAEVSNDPKTSTQVMFTFFPSKKHLVEQYFGN